jgi:predicted nucleic acid-binding protein
VADTWVVNASPLICLDKIGQVQLLSRLASVIVPAGVLAEIQRGPLPLDPATFGPHAVRQIPVIDPSVAVWDLGAGESEVLSCALAESATAIVDDRAARRCANALGVPVRGTLRVLVDAKAAGLVPSVGPLVERLRGAGLFLSERVVEHALKLAGE